MVSPRRASNPSVTEQFYRHLLEFVASDDPEPLLEGVLRSVCEITNGRIALLELRHDTEGLAVLSACYSVPGQDADRQADSISRGIMCQVLQNGKTITTPAAFDDERFHDLDSVRQHQIGAVLCCLVGQLGNGALYLSGPHAFSSLDAERLEVLARHVAIQRTKLLHRKRLGLTLEEQTHALRERLVLEAVERNQWNIARAARELSVGRSYVYAVLRAHRAAK